MFETVLQIWLTIMVLLCWYNYGIDNDQLGVYTKQLYTSIIVGLTLIDASLVPFTTFPIIHAG